MTESLPEHKRRLSDQKYVVDTTPFKTFTQDQSRARRRSNTGKTNLKQPSSETKTIGARRGSNSSALAESAVRATALRRASQDEAKKLRKKSNKVTIQTPPESSRSTRSCSITLPQTGGKLTRRENIQTTTYSEEAKETEPAVEEYRWSSGMREAAEIPIEELSNEERTQWSVPSTKSNAPLRTMLLDRGAYKIPPQKSYKHLRDARRHVNLAHESYDIDGDGVVGPEDMELARRVDLVGRGQLTAQELTQARAKLAARFFVENEERLWQYGESFVGKSLRENVAQLCEEPTEPGKSWNKKVFANTYQDLSTKYRGLRSTSSDGMQQCISGIESDKDDGLTFLPTPPALLIEEKTGLSESEEKSSSVADIASTVSLAHKLVGPTSRQKLFSETHKRLFGDESDTRPTLYERHRLHLKKTKELSGNQESDVANANTNTSTNSKNSSSQSTSALRAGDESSSSTRVETSEKKQSMRRCKTRSELREVRQRERLEESHVLYDMFAANLPQYDNKKVGLVDFHISPPERQHRGLDRILQQQWTLSQQKKEV